MASTFSGNALSRHFLMMLFAVACISAKGQRHDNGITRYRLPEPIMFSSPDFERIIKIEESSNGFVWLATNKGLFCFDGSFFRKIVHSPLGFSAVDAGQINDLYLDREKEQLWIATEMGASLLDLKTEAFADYTFFQKNKPGRTTGECTAVLKDRQGVVWFGVTGLGLVCLDTASRYFPMPENQVAGNLRDHPTIYQLAQDAEADSILWLAFNLGMARFNKNTGRYSFPSGWADDGRLLDLILTTLFSAKDKIYLGSTWKSGALIYDIPEQRFRELKSSSVSPFKISVFQYRSPNSIWAATDEGLAIIDTRSDSLAAYFPNVYNAASETQNFLATPQRLWLGSDDGLVLHDFSRYTVENHYFSRNTEGMPDILFAAVENETKNRLWLGFLFSEFIYDYDQYSRRHVAIPRHAQSARRAPAGLIRLRDGRLLACGDGGIYEVQGRSLIYLPLLKELFAAGEELNFCRQDREGNLWMNSRTAGFYKIDLKTGQYRDCLAGRYFKGTPLVFTDSRENFWLSGDGFSVYNPRTDSILHFPYRPGEQFTSLFPRGFEEDDQGNIWLSDTRTGGLMMVDPRHLGKGIVRRFDARNGPRSNQMRSLKKDPRGRIWAVTAEGLQVFDPRDSTFRLFGAAAGFRLQTENRLDNLCSYLTRLSTGEMLVSYHNGFAIFHPDSLKGNRELPHPYLLPVNANDQALFSGITFGSSNPLRLKHGQDVLEFGFSSIAFYEPEKVAYRYRLKGYEAGWQETNRRYLRYTHLPPGRYTFQLLAVSSDGLHANQPLEWHFSILPPWWATWWAYCAYTLLIALALWAAYTWRKRRWLLKMQLEQKHREGERLKELDALKTRLYTNITHEFRTPLTVIIGMAEQLKSEIENWKSTGTGILREKLAAIQRGGKSLLRLVNQMLDLSKLEAGAMRVHYIRGDIIPFLRYQLESFHSLAESKGIRLEFQAEPETLPTDYDPEKIEAIVSNLLSNAIKFTDAGKVQLTVAREEQSLLIRVRDSGAGIPPENLPHIFDRFYQVDNAANRHAGHLRDTAAAPVEGTGIGLALTRELVKLLGGEISVTSEPGVGSEFTVRLPRDVAAASPQPGENFVAETIGAKEEGPLPVRETIAPPDFETTPLAGAADAASKPLLLIVEDNADVVLYLQSLLQKNYRMEVAKDGRAGLANALEHVPDIILSDVMMPGMDGFELCRALKTDMRTSHIPIVLLTAKADMASKIEGLQHGADAYLAKPFHKEELFVRLEKLIELRKNLQVRYANATAEMAPPTPASLEDDFMRQVRSLLEAHLGDEDFGIPQLSKALGMSRAQLYRKFQALTDQPVAHYFRSMRLHKAQELLQSTDLQVAEIAFQAGFKDPAHFTRVFAEAFGVSPREWRKG